MFDLKCISCRDFFRGRERKIDLTLTSHYSIEVGLSNFDSPSYKLPGTLQHVPTILDAF